MRQQNSFYTAISKTKFLKVSAFIFILISLFSILSFADTVEIRVNKGGLRLRQEPTSSSKSCGTISNRTTVTTLQSVNGWHQIQTGNSDCPTAWVHGYFTKDYYNGLQSSDFLKNWNPVATKIKLDDGFLRVRLKSLLVLST